MNKTKNKLQKGFAVVELAIFIAVIVAVAGIGYWALKSSKAATLTNAQLSLGIPEKPELNSGLVLTASENLQFKNEIVLSAQLVNSRKASIGDIMVSKANLELVRPSCENGDNVGTLNGKTNRIGVYQSYVSSECVNKAWCATFVAYVHNQATGQTYYKKCGVRALIQSAQNKSKYYKIDSTHKPQKGDIVTKIWGTDGGHTGIFVNISGGKYNTIEGNAGDPNTCVKTKSRDANYWQAYLKP